MSAAPASGEISPRQFRDVLGHFPTGVAVITSMRTDGQPIGMAVGSFTSVSLNPPLVAFLPDRGSSTFPAIQDAGRFCVNVLAGGQEDLCRTFATRGADRFGGIEWRRAPHTGSPVLTDAVAWIDCELGDVHDAGDHYIVIGKVLALEVQTPTLPLLFFQGGYGTFAPRSLVVASRGRPSEAVRAAESVREDLERLAGDVGLEVRVLAREDADGLAIIATAGHASGADPVGAILPFYPPFGATIAAWGSPQLRAEWYGNLRTELESEQRAELDADLDRLRERGWMLTFRSEAGTEAEALVEAMAEYGRTPSLERRLFEAGRQIRLGDPALLNESTASLVRTITAPVIGANGPLLHLTLYNFPANASLEFVEHARDVLVATSRAISERLGGKVD